MRPPPPDPAPRRLAPDRPGTGRAGRRRRTGLWALAAAALQLFPAAAAALGQPPGYPLPEPGDPPALSYGDAVILGLVEGATEFLPVSSTGHLILASEALGLAEETPAAGRDGRPIWRVLPGPGGDPPGERFTVKDAADAYVIVIQAGAIAAVLVLYWGRVGSVLLGFLGRDPTGLRLGRNLLVAFLPAVVLGLAFEDLIDRYLFGVGPVVVALFAGGLLMFGVEAWRARRGGAVAGAGGGEGAGLPGPDLHEITVRQSLLIGLLQCVAMWPGTSRSMMTIVGGYLAGFHPRRAAEFSFLLGLPTLAGAAVYKGAKVGPAIVGAFGWAPVLLGCLVAAASAAVSVKWMVAYLTRHGLALFAVYRIILALAVALFVWA